MKKKIILFGILLLISRFGFGQQPVEIETPQLLFKVSPQQFTINTLKIGAEVFNSNQTKSISFFLHGRFDKNDSYSSYYDNNQSQGFGGEIQFRKYINPFENQTTKRGRAFLQGIYVGLYLQGGSYQQDSETTNYNYDPNTGQATTTIIRVQESIVNVGSGFTIGVHRTLWKALFIDAYVGGGVQFANLDRTITPTNPNIYYNYVSITDPEYQGILPKFGVMIGVEL